MQIAVIGAGALGSLFGGRLAADGNDVWLLHRRPAYAATLAERGVTIEAADGATTRVDVDASTDAADAGPVDLAILLVKAHATLPALRDHEACIGPGTRVLSLQNGLTNHHRLREHVGAERTLHGVTYQGASLAGPGHVERSAPGPTVFGGVDGDFARRVRDVFESAGLEARVAADPFEEIWRKQLWGVAIKPVAALTRLPNRELVAHDGLSGLMHRLMSEAAAVAEAEDVSVDAEATFGTLTGNLPGSDHTSSMLQDVRAGRRTEIEDVNGAVVRLGRAHGVEVPCNEVVTALVRGLEAGYLDGEDDADERAGGAT